MLVILYALKDRLQLLRKIVIILIIGNVIGGYLIIKGLESLGRELTISKQLDTYSLAVLEITDGLNFLIENPDIARVMSQLRDLGLVDFETFPSEHLTIKYYLTDKGRLLLTKTYKKKLYPKIFCDLIMTRYWQGYSKEFLIKKKKFEKKHGIPWDKCWEIFVRQIEKEEPKAEDNFNSYLDKTSFDTVMDRVVNPWLEQISTKNKK